MKPESSFNDSDRLHMSRALELAARGLHTTDPNPRVGCVIVHGERTVGEGWHEWAGEPHAEIRALRAAGSDAAGATAYVTLEPCNHQGRTPPCSQALIDAGLRRVVFAMQDPNPRVDGRGAERLRQAGIEVASGLLQEEAAELNLGFLRRIRGGLPWVRLKLAMSLDGRTALASGASQWITSEPARLDVQQWRARSSAVLTGIGTVLADDPRLDVRLPGERLRQPMRVVLDGSLRTPPRARLFEGTGSVWIFTRVMDGARRAALEGRGARIEHLEGNEGTQRGDASSGRFRLEQVLARLAQAEVNEVLVEAGATLAGELLRLNLVDELLLYVAPVLLGHRARPLVALPEPASLASGMRFDLIESRSIGPDLRLRLRPAAAATGETALK
ncbi:MAG TPA: bifunctional diaminohydroxyphosphoribosylaminopyrimidine deaminase/5-amino-6-(5-phosphoribosylamino)uracil reductase RibD [Steroidobacteraceae bacterium]|nr:bifunctional diaminohydroxyphosphoribosylaminopyrimidine deaminase/5-amino-6-(5-phosphoribosylamino)uracil reductase RibD [Steroidobacteraceae bacterium]